MLTQLQRPPPLKTEPRPANQILSALPQDEFERLRPNLREVQLKIGDIVYRPEETIDFVYFVNRGIVSRNGEPRKAGVSRRRYGVEKV